MVGIWSAWKIVAWHRRQHAVGVEDFDGKRNGNHYVSVGTELLARMTASELHTMLESFGCFHRCGRAYIINLNHVTKVTANSAVLKNGAELPLPRGTVASLRNAFFSHFN